MIATMCLHASLDPTVEAAWTHPLLAEMLLVTRTAISYIPCLRSGYRSLAMEAPGGPIRTPTLVAHQFIPALGAGRTSTDLATATSLPATSSEGITCGRAVKTCTSNADSVTIESVRETSLTEALPSCATLRFFLAASLTKWTFVLCLMQLASATCYHFW